MALLRYGLLGLCLKEEVPLWVAVSILPNKILVARKILIVDFSGRLNGTTALTETCEG